MKLTLISNSVIVLIFSMLPVQADVILDWNEITSDALLANSSHQNPGMASRTTAMVNLAMYDSLAMMKQGGTMFFDYGNGHNSPGLPASGKAAAAKAAHTVLSAIYPELQNSLDASLTSSLAGITENAEKATGIAMGETIGQSIVLRRANDGYDASSQYMPTNAVGHWQPDPLNPGQEAWGPAWGQMKTFALHSNTQFMPPPMPDLTSQAYADAFNEVKELGALNSNTRTTDQTNIGLFWAYDRVGMGTPIRLFTDVLRTIAIQQGNTEKENAELFAKATVAMADAGVVAWNSKFVFDHWRPITGIRQADQDGNPLTEADPDWTPLGAPAGGGIDFTPPFPTYLSGHATFGGALFGTLIEHYGTDNISFALTSDEVPGMTRTYSTFSEAMAENGRSRVYLGIHWNYDDTVGQTTGRQIAEFISGSPFIAAVPEPSSILSSIAFMFYAISCRRKRLPNG